MPSSCRVNRRDVLAGLALTGAAAALLPAEAASRAGKTALTVTPIADRLSLISGGGGNVTVFNSPEGVLLVDGGSRESSASVLAQVRALTGAKQVHTLFNTHWHWDQTGSNETLGAAGTRILAHENTRLWLTTRVDSKWEQRVYPPSPAKALPGKTFYKAGTLEFGGERIDYGPLGQAHTDGDIYVYFRNANVLVAGDVVSVGRYPIPDYVSTGWIGGLATATAKLVELAGEGTKIIPGVGPPQSRADVQAENEMLVAVRQRLAKLLAQGLSLQEALAARPTTDYDAKWGDPTLFINTVWPGIVQRARELGVSIV
jgi:cyclase